MSLCVCGHDKAIHIVGGKLTNCGFRQVWFRCACTEFRPASLAEKGAAVKEPLPCNYRTIADGLRDWINDTPRDPKTLHDVYDAHVLLIGLLEERYDCSKGSAHEQG